MPSSLDRVIRNVVVTGRAPLDASDQSIMVGESIGEVYDRGYADGVAAGRREGAVIGESAAAGIRLALEAVRASLADLRRVQGDVLIGTAVEVAEAILGRTPEIDRDVLIDRLRRALAALDDEPLTVLLHPSDRDEIGDEIGALFDVTVEPDATLARGEARIRGAWALADLTQATALAVVREAIT